MKFRRFVIKNLFGYKNVDINFGQNIKILIGENGLGKTTVLNALYFTLTKRFERLSKISFDSIELHYDKSSKVVIDKKQLLSYLNQNREGNRSHFSDILSNASAEQIKTAKEILNDNKISDQHKRIEINRFLRQLGLNINAPTSYIYDLVRRYFDDLEADDFSEVIIKLDDFSKFKILYFPTYRRVEEELKNIGVFSRKEVVDKYNKVTQDGEDIDKSQKKDNIMQFGMADVEDRIKKLTNEIAHSSVIGFSDITGEMLHQLLTDFPEVKSLNKQKLDLDKINIILNRVGPNISDIDKSSILNYVKSGKNENKGLLFFINKLIALYNKQETIDISLKTFADVCNKYLNEKEYVYDEREVTLKIKRKNSDDVVLLSQLSSGEKQIVSLFSKIYLEKDSNYIILFDEPELSLSIYWQRTLLPDIMKSEKCQFLLSVTHSPFIYDNDLLEYTTGLSEYIK